MHKVIMLTGAPATGKSTLRRGLSARIPGVCAYDYGELLRDVKKQEGKSLAYSELRHESAAVITPQDVSSLDDRVIDEIARIRATAHVLVDSHAVTREPYGFRAIPFSLTQLERLRFDVVLILRCDPATAIQRMKSDPGGRREVSAELAREHQLLQEGLGFTYAVVCGCPVFVIDTGDANAKDVEERAIAALRTIGVPC